MTHPKWKAARNSALAFALVAGAFSLVPVQEAEASACSHQGKLICANNEVCFGDRCVVYATWYGGGELIDTPTDHDVY